MMFPDFAATFGEVLVEGDVWLEDEYASNYALIKMGPEDYAYLAMYTTSTGYGDQLWQCWNNDDIDRLRQRILGKDGGLVRLPRKEMISFLQKEAEGDDLLETEDGRALVAEMIEELQE